MKVSAVVVAHNEEAQLDDCLKCLTWADEIVIVLDKCSDRSPDIARRYSNRIIEGSWPIEGPRRHAGIDAANGPWILEVDADERITPELAREIEDLVHSDPDYDYAGIKVDNYIGRRLVRHGWGGSFGKSTTMALYRQGCKHWGHQRVHPAVRLTGRRGPNLANRLLHYVDRDVSDVIARLNRYTSARAQDMRDKQETGSIPNDVRRMASRFLRCYVRRKGYREGGFGLLIALMAALYPILSTLKARLDPECRDDDRDGHS